VARPGGGQDYRGSSSGSSGGDSSSSSRPTAYASASGTDRGGSGDGSANPFVVLPVLGLLLAGVAVYMVRDFRRMQAAEKARSGAAAVPPAPPPPALADAPFHARARMLFHSLDEAWNRRDLSLVRAHVTDATFQRLSTQLRLLNAQGLRNATAEVALLELRAVSAEQDERFDTLHVRILAQCRDRDVPAHLDDAASRAAAGEAPLGPYEECWTFLRSQEAPAARGGEGACPACGAPLQLGETAACAHCGAIVNSGRFDWVLAEMTQAVEARPPAPLPEGAAALCAQDPGFSRQVLEDRAALLFWRWVEAQATGRPRALAKVASPAFLDSVQATRPAGAAAPFRACAVGSVELLSLHPEGPVQRARVEVRWSVEGRHRRSVLELHRTPGAQTPRAGLSTARCPGCSAPLSDNGQPACESCGEQLSASPRDWVLSGIEQD